MSRSPNWQRSAPVAIIIGACLVATLPALGANRVTNYSYHAGDTAKSGKLWTVEGPGAAKVTYDYDSTNGNLTTITVKVGGGKPDLVTEIIAHDPHGRPTMIEDPNNVVTTLSYHPRGWLRSRTVDAYKTEYQYYPTGQIKDIIHYESGGFTVYSSLTFEYDNAQRVEAIQDNLGNRIDYVLDAAGNITGETTKDGGGVIRRTVAREYDNLNRLFLSIGGGDSSGQEKQLTRYAYDANGHLTEESDPRKTGPDVTSAQGQLPADLDYTTFSAYDALNRLTSTFNHGSIWSLSDDTYTGRFDYDALDRVTKVTDGNDDETHYSYNALGDLEDVTSPDIGLTDYTYDSAGNLWKKVDARGVETTYTYDASNRPTDIVYTYTGQETIIPTPDVSFTYDENTAGRYGLGRLTTMADESGTTTFWYSPRGHLREKRITLAGDLNPHIIAYTYTATGEVESITYPSGRIVTYYRTNGEITSVTTQSDAGTTPVSIVSQIAYAPFGPITGMVYGNGLQLIRVYDKSYRLVSDTMLEPSSSPLEYDKSDNITSTGEGTYQYAEVDYDHLSRHYFADVFDDNYEVKYYYDKNGNRVKKRQVEDGEADVINYHIGPNNNILDRVNSWANYAYIPGGKDYSYDANGNTIGIDNLYSTTDKTLKYGEDNRLKEVALNGNTYEFTHNGLGQRVHFDATTTDPEWFVDKIFFYDEQGRIIAEKRPDGWGFEYIYLHGEPIAYVAPDDSYPKGHDTQRTLAYLHSDWLGTPRYSSDAAGLMAEVNRVGIVDPFRMFQYSGPLRPRLAFPGQHYDWEYGLVYNYFRDYDPETGRYVQSDPIGLAGGMNTYAYAKNNALKYTDPLGLWSFSFDAYAGIGGGFTIGRRSDTGEWFYGGRLGIGVGIGPTLEIYDEGPTARRLRYSPNDLCTISPSDNGTSVGSFAVIGVGVGPYNRNYGGSAGRHFDGTGGSYFNPPGFDSPITPFGGNGLSGGGAFGVEVLGW